MRGDLLTFDTFVHWVTLTDLLRLLDDVRTSILDNNIKVMMTL